MPKETYLPSLFSLFRQYGYDGATLSKISAATGLGKASLYYHFPGGKDEMVTSVLDYAESWLQANVLQILTSQGSPEERLQKMCDRVSDLYAGGAQPCVLAMLQTGTGRDLFHDQIKTLLETWIEAIIAVLVEFGLDEALAVKQGQDTLIAIQGSLIMSRSLDDTSLFTRTLQQLPNRLLQTA